jgi:hypothetical protein
MRAPPGGWWVRVADADGLISHDLSREAKANSHATRRHPSGAAALRSRPKREDVCRAAEGGGAPAT